MKPNVGDLVVLYTDGVSEATNQDGQELGRDGLMALARQLDSRSPEAFGTQLAEALRDFRGGTVPQDDETLIVMQRVSTTRAAVSLGTRTRAESLSGRPTSTAVGAPPLASESGVRRMECGDVCLLTDEGHRAIEGSSRPLFVNLTVSMILLPVGVDE